MKVPENLKYTEDHEWFTEDHEWLRVEGEFAFVGITDYAQHELGDIVFVDITTEGETLGKGEVFGSIEAVKTVSDIMLPVGGEIVEVNGALESDAAIVNSDPYGEGWLVKIKVTDAAEADTLLDAAAYHNLIGA